MGSKVHEIHLKSFVNQKIMLSIKTTFPVFMLLGKHCWCIGLDFTGMGEQNCYTVDSLCSLNLQKS